MNRNPENLNVERDEMNEVLNHTAKKTKRTSEAKIGKRTFTSCSIYTYSVMKSLCDQHKIGIKDVVADCKIRYIVKARAQVAKAMHEKGIGIKEIARAMKKHHTTILHYVYWRKNNG